jgi:hypothetical protein
VSTDHWEAVGLTLATIIDRPDSVDFIDSIFTMIEALVDPDESDPVVASLAILMRKLILMDGSYYDQLNEQGSLGFLWAIVDRDFREVPPRIRPWMVSLLRCVIESIPLAQGPFSLETLRAIPPDAYLQSILTCHESVVHDWFEILIHITRNDAGEVNVDDLIPLLCVVNVKLLRLVSFDVRLSWLMTWYTSVLADPILFVPVSLYSRLIPAFSWLFDEDVPEAELEYYFGLILPMIGFCEDQDQKSVLVDMLSCPLEGDEVSLLAKIGEFLEKFTPETPELQFTSEFTKEELNLWEQALKIQEYCL